jgi:ATP-dependent Clp protease adapter protein ClpS
MQVILIPEASATLGVFHESADSCTAMSVHDEGTAVCGDSEFHVMDGIVKTDPSWTPTKHFPQICQHNIADLVWEKS